MTDRTDDEALRVALGDQNLRNATASAADHTRIENLARALCADAGRDWDAPHTKRVRYIAQARRIIEQDNHRPAWGWLGRVFG